MEKGNNSVETIVAEIEISYKPKVCLSTRPKITGSEDAYLILMDTWDKSKLEFVEQFKVMLLNRANRVLGICTLTTGSSTGTIADPKLVFAVALKANATNVILAHNHPSGTLEPSKSDSDITRKMKAAGEFLELKVLDHLIVSIEGFYSFATEGTL